MRPGESAGADIVHTPPASGDLRAAGGLPLSAAGTAPPLDHEDEVRFDRTMKPHRQIIVFDTADLAAESTFWAGLLEGAVEAEDDWHTVYVDGEPRLAFQLAPNHVAPDWPDGEPQQMHLDLHIDDLAAGHAEVVALGARLLKASAHPESGEGFQVYADPAGHPFCLCWG